jgi:hypothetical protein
MARLFAMPTQLLRRAFFFGRTKDAITINVAHNPYPKIGMILGVMR